MRRPLLNLLATVAAAIGFAGAIAVVLAFGGGGFRPLAAALDVQQTCSARIPPNTAANVSAAVQNTGDEAFPTVVVVGDAATPGNEADDFTLTLSSGDNGNLQLDPGETWTFTGTYTVDGGDSANVVNVSAVSSTGTEVDDLDGCTTDVIEPPEPGVRARAQEIAGRVLVRFPGSNTFVDLSGTTEIPVGAEVNADAGTVRLTEGLGGGQSASADFFQGTFIVRQSRARNAVMMLWLSRGNFGACRSGTAKTTGAPRKKVRRLWGDGRGRFGTRGRYSAATVRGTRWLVEDRCDGTLTRVARGRVSVQDFVRRKTVQVRAGRTYLAGPRRK